MSPDPKRVIEVRLILIVLVDVTNPDLIAALTASGGKPVAEVVSSEVVSNLESVPYVESVIASKL